MKRRVTMIYGHTVPESFCTALGLAYAEGVREGGGEVRECHLHRMQFDPILWRAYLEIQELEPDLLKAQEDIRWAEHVVFVFPIWWGMPPALMKGFIDRVFHPQFAFKYEPKTAVFQTKLLAGRSAALLCTMDSPPWYYRMLVGEPGIKMMKRSLLKFCGFNPVRVSMFGSVRFSTPARRKRWLKEAQRRGHTFSEGVTPKNNK